MGKILEPDFGFGIKVVHLSSVVVKSSDCCTDVLTGQTLVTGNIEGKSHAQ